MGEITSFSVVVSGQIETADLEWSTNAYCKVHGRNGALPGPRWAQQAAGTRCAPNYFVCSIRWCTGRTGTCCPGWRTG